MVAVEIRTPVYDEESNEVTWHGRAIVRADGTALDIYGDSDVIDQDVSVVDIGTGKPIRGTDDPEAWARSLPCAYRSGDLIAVVLLDTDPPVRSNEDGAGRGREIPTVPAPPRPAVPIGSVMVAAR
jgi:hypothetical protein